MAPETDTVEPEGKAPYNGLKLYNSSVTYDADTLPPGVTQPFKYPDHAADYAGDPPDPKRAAAEQELIEFREWKAAQEAAKSATSTMSEEELKQFEAFKESQAAAADKEPEENTPSGTEAYRGPQV